ncbi:MAG TPA: universal stress protein [Stellaceae bacterium]|nr:universal stress protein [Stellaceae bacterium]
MPLKDLLVCFDRTEAGYARLELAFNLARASRAYLAGAYVLPETHVSPVGSVGFGLAPPAGMTGLGEEGVSPSGVLREAEAAESAEQHFKSKLRLHGIEGEWHLLADGDSAALIELAKSVDLTIAGQRPPNSQSNGASRFRPEDIVVAAGRPVLIVPYAGAFETVGKRILIAWDGTREATRALHDALPLFTDPEATVVFVGSHERDLEQQRPALDRVVHHLHHHGVAARPEETLRGGLAVSDVLLSRAADLGADLIVSGGYHHSQLREALLGGVSRELLEHMTVPVLMSH